MYRYNKCAVTDSVRVMLLLARYANHVKGSVARSSMHLFESTPSMVWIQRALGIALNSPNWFRFIRKSDSVLKRNQTFSLLASLI